MSKSRRKFLKGLAAAPMTTLPQYVGAEGPEVGAPGMNGKLSIVITGLCAFVPHGDDLSVLLLDAQKDEGASNPKHSAAMALLRFDKSGALLSYPTVKALEEEVLSVESYKPTAAGAIDLKKEYLVDMTSATAASGASAPTHPNDVIHPDTLTGRRKVLARLDLVTKVLGGKLSTRLAHPPVRYTFANGYTPTVTDEIRLTMDLPTQGACLVSSPLPHGRNRSSWHTPLVRKDDGSAVLILSNVPIHQPFAAGDVGHDHHFTRYYELARQSARKLAPSTVKSARPLCPGEVAGIGGAVPRCAMAIFKDK